LVDNTLGRTWYDMRQGETVLRDTCQYLVRFPNEVFLPDGEPEPDQDGNTPYVLFRAKKDPRDLRILDPGVGSAHFLLYSFSLLSVIYEEAWADPDLPEVKRDFPSLAELRLALPGLILERNLFGIDIDLRATQIAGFALWLKAQTTYQQLGLRGRERPHISRTNIVCAEPMPGERHLLDQFLEGVTPKVLSEIVVDVFDRMKLAGEAGSLLRVDQEISDSIAAARSAWLAQPQPEQLSLFGTRATREPRTQYTLFDITDKQFWNEAEDRIVQLLDDFAKASQMPDRRLFANDAAQGFAFVDLCRQTFDVALMNPPFGAASIPSKSYIEKTYSRSKQDVYAAFVERGLDWLVPRGMLGAITSRTGFFLSTFQKWREEIILGEAQPTVFADLGQGVLDTAMVETAAYCLRALQ
jgi:hypothetical protein